MPNAKIAAHDNVEQNRPANGSNDETKWKDAVTIFVTPTEDNAPEDSHPPASSVEEKPEIELKETLNRFVGNDILLQKLRVRLRHLAILQFCLAVTVGCLAIADIEISKTTRHLVAVELNCEDTYGSNYLRSCPAISNPDDVIRDDLINRTIYNELSQYKSYAGRWIAANSKYAKTPWIAGILIKIFISILTFGGVYSIFVYHRTELFVMKMTRYLPEDSSLLKSPKIKSFCIKVLLLSLHLPPLFDAWLDAEVQLIVMLRVLICGVKVLKECNELRYHRLGSVLSNLAHIKIHGGFLLKTYFLRYPQTSLFGFYLAVVVVFPYLVIVAEYRAGVEVSYGDAWWLMVVTVTNLGSGEVQPATFWARLTVGFASLIGVVTTALWVNVIAKYLELPQEERRILAMVEHQKARVRERTVAAKCIQRAWKLHRFQQTERGGVRLAALQKASKKAVWDWKCTRHSVSRVKRAIESHFSTEDTLIVATNLARIMSSTKEHLEKSSVEEERLRKENSLLSNVPDIPQLPSRAGSLRHGEEAHRTLSTFIIENHAHLKSNEVTDVRHLAEALNSLKQEVSEMNKHVIQAQRKASSQFNDIHAFLRNTGTNR